MQLDGVCGAIVGHQAQERRRLPAGLLEAYKRVGRLETAGHKSGSFARGDTLAGGVRVFDRDRRAGIFLEAASSRSLESVATAGT